MTIGAVHAGSAGNIIPDEAQLRGPIRSWDPDVRTKLLLGVSRTAVAVAAMAGAPSPVVKLEEGAQAVVNDPALVARTAPVLRAAFGDKLTEVTTVTSGSEDYSAFVEAGVPSFYIGIGALAPAVVAAARGPGTYPPGNHNPGFAPVPEPTIRNGVEVMTLSILNALTAA